MIEIQNVSKAYRTDTIETLLTKPQEELQAVGPLTETDSTIFVDETHELEFDTLTDWWQVGMSFGAGRPAVMPLDTCCVNM